MRCKSHFSDISSDVGVCASCLRERLLALIAAQFRQAQAQAQSEAQDRRKSDPHHPPLIFPRSVSPYICRRLEDASWHHHQNDRRFYSTPQVGHTTRKKKHSKFSLISSLFSSSKSDEADSDPRVSRDSLGTCSSSSISSSSSSWFSSIFSSRRKKQTELFSLDEPTTAGRRSCRTRDRGMSPAKFNNENQGYLENEVSPSESSYLSESSPAWWKQGTTPASRRKGTSQNSRNVSGMVFCLSPLVRASPNSHRNQKGHPPGEIGFPGETRFSSKPQLSTAASLCANRSRKLADFGRFNYNP